MHTCAIYLILLVLFDSSCYYVQFNEIQQEVSFHNLAVWVNEGHLKIMKDMKCF